MDLIELQSIWKEIVKEKLKRKGKYNFWQLYLHFVVIICLFSAKLLFKAMIEEFHFKFFRNN